MKIIRLCLPVILKRKVTFFIYVFLNLFCSFSMLIVTYLTGNLIDCMSREDNINLFFRIIILIVILRLMSSFFSFLVNNAYAKMQVECCYYMSSDLISKVHRSDFSRSESLDPIYLNKRISQDVGVLMQFSVETSIQVMINIFSAIIILILLLKISIFITSFLCFFIVLYIVVYSVTRRKMYSKSMDIKESQDIYFTRMSEQFTKLKFIKIHSANNIFKNRLKDSFEKFKIKYISYSKFSNFTSSIDNMILTISQSTLFITGGIGIVNKQISVGSFLIILSLFPQLLNIVSYFFRLAEKYQNVLASYDRIKDIKEWKLEPSGKYKTDSILTIETKNLSFYFGDKKVFENLNLYFEKGKIYTIIGNNGAGKTTLMNSIIGLYASQNGEEIYYNNHKMEEYDLEYMRYRHFGVSDQDSTLIEGTIRLNIALSDDSLYDSKIQEILEIVNLESLVNSLPLGINTRINSISSNFSGGEKQKIGIARVLFKNPSVMIFDEPTNSLDDKSVLKFLDYIQLIKKDNIIIIITHDDNIYKNSDYSYRI